jgi:hypothetical protein
MRMRQEMEMARTYHESGTGNGTTSITERNMSQFSDYTLHTGHNGLRQQMFGKLNKRVDIVAQM